MLPLPGGWSHIYHGGSRSGAVLRAQTAMRFLYLFTLFTYMRRSATSWAWWRRCATPAYSARRRPCTSTSLCRRSACCRRPLDLHTVAARSPPRRRRRRRNFRKTDWGSFQQACCTSSAHAVDHTQLFNGTFSAPQFRFRTIVVLREFVQCRSALNSAF